MACWQSDTLPPSPPPTTLNSSNQQSRTSSARPSLNPNTTANMSCHYNGMQQKLLERNPSADIIPCAGYYLNLVERTTVDCCLDTVRPNCFSINQSIKTYLLRAISRKRIGGAENCTPSLLFLLSFHASLGNIGTICSRSWHSLEQSTYRWTVFNNSLNDIWKPFSTRDRSPADHVTVSALAIHCRIAIDLQRITSSVIIIIIIVRRRS